MHFRTSYRKTLNYQKDRLQHTTYTEKTQKEYSTFAQHFSILHRISRSCQMSDRDEANTNTQTETNRENRARNRSLQRDLERTRRETGDG